MGEPAVEWREIERRSWQPQEDLKISEWSEKKIVLADHTEEKGPLRLRRTPYSAGIMDTVLDPHVETIVCCKPAQIAGTTLFIAVAGYYLDQDPCPIMFVLADSDTADYIGQERIRKMIEKSPGLSYLADGMKYNVKESAFTFKNGAYLAMAWATSVPKLASRPIKIIVFDEVDKPGYYIASKEASPISLGVERTETFYNRKIFILSTPTIDSGNITRELDSCDVVFDFHCPCPGCGVYQPLRWSRQYSTGFPEGVYRDEDSGELLPLGQVVWDGGREATPDQIEAARYECGSCGAKWTTVEKALAVGRGKWVARVEPEFKPKKVGYHLNRLYSLLGRSGDLDKLVADFIKAVNDPDPKVLQGFVNSTLAEAWTQTVTKADQNVILKARTKLEPMTVPAEAVGLTCGIDMQKDGFPFVVRAWWKDLTSWLIHYGVLSKWEDVENLLFKTEYPIDGKPNKFTRIWRAGIDTGGTRIDDEPSMTEQCYWFIRDNGVGRGTRVYGTKGASRPLQGKLHLGKILDKTPSGRPIQGGIRLIMLDTSDLKDMLFYRLRRAIEGQGAQSAYLHAETGVDYARQITAEEKRINEKGVQEWVVVRKKNHFLDCETICHALADPEFPGGGVNMLARVQEIEGKRKQAEIKRKQTGGGRRDKFERPAWLDR